MCPCQWQLDASMPCHHLSNASEVSTWVYHLAMGQTDGWIATLLYAPPPYCKTVGHSKLTWGKQMLVCRLLPSKHLLLPAVHLHQCAPLSQRSSCRHTDRQLLTDMQINATFNGVRLFVVGVKHADSHNSARWQHTTHTAATSSV